MKKMKFCKNCGKEISEHLTYCSYTCRNVFVNKNYRDYNKIKITFQNKRDYSESEYYNNPDVCIECGNIIPFKIGGKKKKFCNHSCSAKYNNKYRKGSTHIMTDSGREILRKSAIKHLVFTPNRRQNERKIEYNNSPNYCIHCGTELLFRFRNRSFCSQQCKNEFYKKNKSDYRLYRDMCSFKFNLSQYKDEFDFGLIKQYGWYSASNHGGNINGVSRDHKFSVNEGFKKMINPLILSHPANCELMVHRQNIKKNWRSSITIEKLISNIEEFDKKYGNYYNMPVTKFITIEELRNLSVEYTQI